MTNKLLELYLPASKKQGGEYEFVKLHRDNTVTVQDANGNDDDLFQAANIKKIDRPQDYHGYNPEQDARFYDQEPDDKETSDVKVKKNDKHVEYKGRNDLKNNRRSLIAARKVSDVAEGKKLIERVLDIRRGLI